MTLGRFSRLFAKTGLAVDLGTANIRIFLPGRGIVVNEPSVVAVDTYTNEIVAVGTEAKSYMGRTPKRIKVMRPIRDGVIADFEITRQLITLFVRKALSSGSLFRPPMIFSMPLGITPVEKRAVVEAGQAAGAGVVRLMEEPMAAAIGAGLPILEPVGNLVLDIGSGTSEAAVITLASIACSRSIRIAGDEMDAAIQRYLQDRFHLSVGENMAENVKLALGSAMELPGQEKRMRVAGKHVVNGAPTTVEISSEDVRMALSETVNSMLSALRECLEGTPPDLIADIHGLGILLVGGSSLLPGLAQRISEDIRVKVTVDPDPLTTVVRGAGKVFDPKAGLAETLMEEG